MLGDHALQESFICKEYDKMQVLDTITVLMAECDADIQVALMQVSTHAFDQHSYHKHEFDFSNQTTMMLKVGRVFIDFDQLSMSRADTVVVHQSHAAAHDAMSTYPEDKVHRRIDILDKPDWKKEKLAGLLTPHVQAGFRAEQAYTLSGRTRVANRPGYINRL